MTTGSTRKNRSLDGVESSTATPGTKVFFVLIVILVVVVYPTPIPASWTISLEQHHVDLDRFVSEARDGDWTRHVGLAALGLFGLVAAWLPGARRVRADGALAYLCLGYLAWCMSSCVWAEDGMLSMRRVAGAMCEIFAGFAVAKRVTPWQFVWIVFACTSLWLGCGILAELSLGTFHPWEEGLRFAGIFHPNTMGIVCALLTISSICLAAGLPRGRWLFWIAAVLGCVFLYFTRSRTAMGTTIVVVVAHWIITAPSRRVLSRVALASCVALALGLVLSTVEEFQTEAVTLGRTDNSDLSSLTGRVPLWKELLQQAGTRSWVGFGYNGFWTAERVEGLSGFEWGAISAAHSVYIDLVLSVGYVGAVLCISVVVLGQFRAYLLARRFPAMGYDFIAMLLTYALVSGISETMFGLASIMSFFMTCGICFMALRDAKSPQAERRSHRPPQFAAYPLVGYGESLT